MGIKTYRHKKTKGAKDGKSMDNQNKVVKKCGIYKITSPVGGIYIGQSIDIDARFYSYKCYNCKEQLALYDSLVRYGYESHKMEVLELCERRFLNKRELFYIGSFKSYNTSHGLNLRKGTGYKPKPVLSKQKIRLAHNIRHLRREYRMSQEWLAKLMNLAGKSTVNAYERGRANPTIEGLIKLRKIFKVTIDDLILKKF